MPAKKGHRVQIAAYLDEPVYEALQQLSRQSRIPAAVYVREAIDDLLGKYRAKPVRKGAKR